MIAAVVPVAFFTANHVDMTDRFLTALGAEVDRIGVWHNGGALAGEGSAMLAAYPGVYVEDAADWRFFRMWNRGVAWAREQGADVCLVLNNDIAWPVGALRTLGESLAAADPDIATASPDPEADFDPKGLSDLNALPAYRGLLGWCFAVRPTMWQVIDERYEVWYGDDELAQLMNEAGSRCVRAVGVPVTHPEASVTMKHRPGVEALRLADEALYTSKWVAA